MSEKQLCKAMGLRFDVLDKMNAIAGNTPFDPVHGGRKLDIFSFVKENKEGSAPAVPSDAALVEEAHADGDPLEEAYRAVKAKRVDPVVKLRRRIARKHDVKGRNKEKVREKSSAFKKARKKREKMQVRAAGSWSKLQQKHKQRFRFVKADSDLPALDQIHEMAAETAAPEITAEATHHEVALKTILLACSLANGFESSLDRLDEIAEELDGLDFSGEVSSDMADLLSGRVVEVANIFGMVNLEEGKIDLPKVFIDLVQKAVDVLERLSQIRRMRGLAGDSARVLDKLVGDAKALLFNLNNAVDVIFEGVQGEDVCLSEARADPAKELKIVRSIVSEIGDSLKKVVGSRSIDKQVKSSSKQAQHLSFLMLGEIDSALSDLGEAVNDAGGGLEEGKIVKGRLARGLAEKVIQKVGGDLKRWVDLYKFQKDLEKLIKGYLPDTTD